VYYVTINSLFPSRLSAYRPFHSVETTLVSVHNDLVRAGDNGLVTGLVTPVDHPILLSTLIHRHAVCDTALFCFWSYLDHRCQSFAVAGDQTDDFILDCSVPQGSLLFIFYTTEARNVFDRHGKPFYLFADDKQTSASGRVSEVDII